MSVFELPEDSSRTSDIHNCLTRQPIKVDKPFVEVIYQQQVGKVQHAQGLHLGSEDLRKFITSPAVKYPRHSSDTRGTTLRLDVHERSADKDCDNGNQEEAVAPIPVWQAIRNGDLAAVQQAIERDDTENHGMLVNTREPETETTLLYMVAEHIREQPEQLLELLLKHGAEPDAPSVYGVRAMHAVLINCVTNPVPAIDVLLEHNADINCCDGDGWTPLHYAARFRHNPDSVVRHLVDHGARINAVDVTNKTPLFALLANGDHVATFSWLIHVAHADLTAKGEFLFSRPTSGTVFLQTAKYGRVDCMKELVRSTVAMEQLRRTVSCQELDLATAILQRKLEKKNNQDDLSPHLEELIALTKEFRLTLEDDPGSMVANEIYLEKHGKKKNLARRNILFTALRARPSEGKLNSSAQLSSQSQKDDTLEDVQHEHKGSSLLKRMVSTLASPSTSFQRKSKSSPQQPLDKNTT